MMLLGDGASCSTVTGQSPVLPSLVFSRAEWVDVGKRFVVRCFGRGGSPNLRSHTSEKFREPLRGARW